MLGRRTLLFTPLALAADPQMAHIPGGTFRMGSDIGDIQRKFPNAGRGLLSMLEAETPAHEVTVPPFRMDRREVSNGEFQSFVRASPEWRRDRVGGAYLRHWDRDNGPAGQTDFPVVYITWHAAAAYAEWAGKRLPAEAEWEFAARGGRTNPEYPWGDDPPSPERANYSASGIGHPVRSGAYPANAYGLFDLAGNVWEFCQDRWRATYAAANAGSTGRRVIRGGSFAAAPFNLRVTARDSHPADSPGPHVGFRCAATSKS